MEPEQEAEGDYYDVVLHSDENGYGLHFGLRNEYLVVVSFRRLDEHDKSPAEICKRIQIGHVLLSINGVHVSSQQQVYELVKDTYHCTFRFSTRETQQKHSSYACVEGRNELNFVIYELKRERDRLRDQVERTELEKYELRSEIQTLREEYQRMKFSTRPPIFQSNSDAKFALQQALDECKSQTIAEMQEKFRTQLQSTIEELKLKTQRHMAESCSHEDSHSCPILLQIRQIGFNP